MQVISIIFHLVIQRIIIKKKVLVESQKTLHIATVAVPKIEMDPEDLPDKVSPILHKATENELKKDNKNREDAKRAFKIAKDKIENINLR